MKQRPPGNPPTFEDLYAEHAQSVLVVVWLLGVAEGEQADVAQEVWLRVYRRLPAYDPAEGTPRAWILGITRFTVRDWHRTRRRRPELSTLTDAEPTDLRTAETDTDEARRRAALWAFFTDAVPSADQREAFALHEISGLTVEEVAKATGVRKWTAQWRIKMARSKLKKAQAALTTEEREKLRAVVLPLTSVSELAEAMRSSISDEAAATVWARVSERITLAGGHTDARLGDRTGTDSHADPGTAADMAPGADIGVAGMAPTPMDAAPGYLLTGGQLSMALAGVFVAGALSGAGALYALLARDTTTVTASVTDTLPVPTPAPAPEQTTSAAPSASPPPTAPTAAGPTTATLRKSEALLDRARSALRSSPAEALALTRDHAAELAGLHFAEREEIAVRALLQLGRRPEAEARAAALARAAPTKRPAMEALLGPFQ